MMSNFEADESDALKGQGCGALPFAGWEDPPLPLTALHHLHQVSHNYLMIDQAVLIGSRLGGPQVRLQFACKFVRRCSRPGLWLHLLCLHRVCESLIV